MSDSIKSKLFLSENNIIFQKGRLMWIDWMKAIGIFLIVYGHFFSLENKYVYVFSVPLFFMISGFLCKKEIEEKIFWKKLWYNLILPMLLISLINCIFNSLLLIHRGTFDMPFLYKFPFQVLLGFHSGVGTLWFVYTLVLLKIIVQYLPHNKLIQIIAFLFFPIVGVLIDLWNPLICGRNIVNNSNSIINICMAYPFFYLGYVLKRWKKELNILHSLRAELFMFLFSIVLVFMCGKMNSGVWMYKNGYGNNILLFILGGVAGTVMVFIFSKWLNRIRIKFVVNISNGTILILGFHCYLILLVRKFFSLPTSMDLLYSFLIILIFIPVIRFTEKYMPCLIGKYRAQKMH